MLDVTASVLLLAMCYCWRWRFNSTTRHTTITPHTAVHDLTLCLRLLDWCLQRAYAQAATIDESISSYGVSGFWGNGLLALWQSAHSWKSLDAVCHGTWNAVGAPENSAQEVRARDFG
jgi:hypothetical protein